jgi:nitrogen regulatory protein PII
VKLVSAIIRPPKLEAVLAALEDVAIERMTICDGQSFDIPRGQRESTGADDPLQRIVNLEIVVNDDFLERAIEAICCAAKTGSEEASGDGKLFIFPVEEAITIDQQRRGPQAV